VQLLTRPVAGAELFVLGELCACSLGEGHRMMITVADHGGGQHPHDLTVLASAGYLTGRQEPACEPGTMRYVVREVTQLTPWDITLGGGVNNALGVAMDSTIRVALGLDGGSHNDFADVDACGLFYRIAYC
jgi:hypothetical protein